MAIANARWGGNPATPPSVDWPGAERLIVRHNGSVPDAVVGVSPDPQSTVIPQGIGRSFFSGAGRTATVERTYVVRPMRWRSRWFNGYHGVVTRLRPSAWDDHQRPFLRPVRTLRSAPAVPWDVGTALGPAGRATGDEG